jgi:DnaJ-class molecular chaperone
MDIQAEDLPRLEKQCVYCAGTGHRDNGPFTNDKCSWCDGVGYIPTQLGAEVLALMKHNFKSLLNKHLSID